MFDSNVLFNWKNNSKFNTVAILISFINKRNEENIAKYALLSSVLGSVTKNYDTKRKLNKRMYDLYNCNIYFSSLNMYKNENLSLFVGGTYNFATSIADMEVLGILSRKISTMFGPIGNVSINTLFNVIPGVDLSKDSSILDKINKIPGIELSNKAFRKFIAEIKGNINGEDYVTSFKWIN